MELTLYFRRYDLLIIFFCCISNYVFADSQNSYIKGVEWCKKDRCNFLNENDALCHWNIMCASNEAVENRAEHLKQFLSSCEKYGWYAMRSDEDYKGIGIDVFQVAKDSDAMQRMGVVQTSSPACYLGIVPQKMIYFKYRIIPCKSLTVALDAQTNGSRFEWIISDGQKVQGKNTEVSFKKPGTYKISLVVDGQTSSTATKEVTLAPQTLEIIDLACEDKSECKGTSLLTKNKDNIVVPKSPRELNTSMIVERTGIVTDGISKLLLRLRTDKPVEFSIKNNDSDCKLGVLKTRDLTTSSCKTLKIEPEDTGDGGKCVFAIYEAPNTFPQDQSKATFQYKVIQDQQTTTETSITLYKQPVILLHGLWSNSHAWDGLASELSKSGYPAISVGYSPSIVPGEYPGAETFDPENNPVGPPELKKGIEQELKKQRDAGIATSQVNIVAHSMGGLVARSLIKYKKNQYEYQRLDNYMKGDFARLITVGTPHSGTRVADLLVHNKCHTKQVCFGKVPTKKEPKVMTFGLCEDMTLEAFFKGLGHPIGPAVYDLQTGSTALQHLGASDVYAHTIAGITPLPIHFIFVPIFYYSVPVLVPTPVFILIPIPIETTDSEKLNEIDFIFDAVSQLRFVNEYLIQAFNITAIGDNRKDNPYNSTAPVDTINELFRGEAHDSTVPVSSQQGGLTGDNITILQNLVTHTQETKSTEVWMQVKKLLNTPTTSQVFAQGLPKANLENYSNKNFELDKERCTVSQNNVNAFYFPELIFDFLKSISLITPAYAVVTTSTYTTQPTSLVTGTFEPIEGTVVKPDEKITLRFDIQGGIPQKGAIFRIGSTLIPIMGESPYIVEYTPSNEDMGKIPITIFTLNDSPQNNMYSFESYIVVSNRKTSNKAK
ncbi:PKD domain protein [Beggiatoa alba B18LD]|uniref:PKD domain protein n=1 Tax=Beggiatoa alba B18LD TaxID=395493 RepID=I3CC35_9GAMM|nr:PKD domain-containing protein [Beggiatoa alba]EIJ41178.1 PKD domain protein [Beggiatoa alba B18LD]